MEVPSTGELIDALTCLSQLYRHCDDAEFPRRALKILCELVPCDMAAFELRPDSDGRQAIGFSEPFEVHEDRHFAAFEAQMSNDPLDVAVSDLVSAPQDEGRGVYCDYIRHNGIRDRLDFSIAGDGPEIMGVALSRDRRGFSERDRRMVRLLRPHLIEAWRNAQAVGRLRRKLCQRPPQPHEGVGKLRTSCLEAAALTPRETDVLASVARGLTNKQVARELGISARTVTKHLENIFSKLGVTTRAAAAALYASCAPVQVHFG